MKKETFESISEKKKYILRLLELAKKDPQVAALIPKDRVFEKANVAGLTYDRIVATYLNGYAGRPALGERTYELKTDKTTNKTIRAYLPSYTTTSYYHLQEKIKAVAMAWRHHPLCQVQPAEFVCIMGFASIDFSVLDIACIYAHAVTVPLQSSTSGADLNEIFSNVEPVVLAATLNDLPLAVEHAIQQKTIKSLIVFNYDDRVDDERAMVEQAKANLKAASINTHLLTLDELIDFGKKQTWSFLPAQKGNQEKMAAIIHSSGSTGKPKGAVLSTKAVMNTWKGYAGALPRLTVIFAPLNHFMGRVTLIKTLNVGGTAYFTLKPDMSTLFEDIRLARPTFLAFFPRIFELIYQYFQNEVSRRLKSGQSDPKSIEAAIKADMKSTYLGDRLLIAIVGSAPTSPKVKAFIKDCFDILLIEGYGNTEAGSGTLATDGRINREFVLDYKLKDVPELGYFKTDKPFPRGELCVKTKFGVKSYYKQTTATAGLNDEWGYNLTGDIVEERGPDQIVIIDRRKDVLKLSQGEYVAVGTLGTIFEAGTAVIQQMYVYGNSHRSYLLAVVVPAMEVIHQIIEGEVSEGQLKNLIRDELQKVGQKEGLKSFEIPKDFLIEKETFSQKNGLLSSVRKRLRPALKRKYSTALEALYQEHEQIQKAEIDALKDPNSSLSIEEKFLILLESNLGIKDFETEEARTYSELGGDSLGAALLAISIEEIFGISMGADLILSPKGHIQHWVQYIETAQTHQSSQATFASIHGKGANTIAAKDLQLEKFIDKARLDNAANLPDEASSPKVVLMTGANGFLGHILCLKWLEKLAPIGGKLICIVRASNHAAAQQRLDKQFKGVDTTFETRYHMLAAEHLEVLAGDISEPFLGLEATIFERVASEVDRICHVAALVNHRLGYQHLFRPNVVGTAEIIRLAITHQKKAIDFISTVGVNALIDKRNGIHENAPLLESVKLTKHYAAGYAASKWAGEHLLQQAHQTLDVTTNLVRCDMILADQQYKGQINTQDMLTRLLYSIIITGIAPKSFYPLNADGSKASAHYDGIPVDVLSNAIVGLSQLAPQKCTIFNAQNYLQDEVSLDCFVDWIETAAYAIHRIEDHSTWYHQMETKLKSLPEEQAQHSAIDVLMAYRLPLRTNQRLSGYDNFIALAKKTNGGIPHLSEAYLHKCLRDMVALGIIGN